MAIAARVGRLEHDYDRDTGAQRIVVDVDLVALLMAALACLLALRLTRLLHPQPGRAAG
jgi:hypothetical protein